MLIELSFLICIGFLWLKKVVKNIEMFLMTLAISKYSNDRNEIRNGITCFRPFSFKENKWYLNIQCILYIQTY